MPPTPRWLSGLWALGTAPSVAGGWQQCTHTPSPAPPRRQRPLWGQRARLRSRCSAGLRSLLPFRCGPIFVTMWPGRGEGAPKMGRTLKLRVHTWPFLPGTRVVTISWGTQADMGRSQGLFQKQMPGQPRTRGPQRGARACSGLGGRSCTRTQPGPRDPGSGCGPAERTSLPSCPRTMCCLPSGRPTGPCR